MEINKGVDEKTSLLKMEDNSTGLIEDEKPGFFHPTRRFFAYTILFMVSMYSVSGFFAHDAPGVVQKQMMDELQINAQQFGLLYSIYALPNCILPFFGGYLLDRFGLRLGTVVCLLFELVGATVVAVGPYIDSYGLMLVGRLLFGIGAETSFVSSHSVIMYWFRDKEIALAVSLSTSAGRLGSWGTYSLNLMAVNYWGTWRVALWLGAITVAAALVACLIFCVMDKIAERVTRQHEEIAEEPIRLQDVKNFQPHFWITCVLATIFYAILFPFQSTAVALLQDRYHYHETDAGNAVSLLPFTSIFLSPVFGLIISKYPKYAYINLIGILIFNACFYLLAFWESLSPMYVLFIMTIPYSLVPACIFPYLSLVVPQQYNGTGYGLFTCIMNVGQVLIYYMQGWVVDFFQNDVYVLNFYGGLAVCATIFNLIWIWFEIKKPADMLALSWAAAMHDGAHGETSPPTSPESQGKRSGMFDVPDADDFTKRVPRQSKSFGHVYDMQRNDKEQKVAFLSTKYNKKKHQVEDIYSGHQSLRYGSIAYGYKVVKKDPVVGKPMKNPVKNTNPPQKKK